MPADEFPHSLSTIVHVGQRFDQYHFFGANRTTGKHCSAAPLPAPAILASQRIYNAKANVMPGLLILKAGVPQADYQFHEKGS
jgi:hypothetical protein